MPDEITPPNAPNTPPETPSGNTPPPADGDSSLWASRWDGKMDSLPPQVREIIRKANEEAADYRHKKKAAEDAERQRMAEAGEYKALYDKLTGELEPLKKKAERAEAVEAFMAKTLKTRIDALPEQYRALVPKYDDLLQTLAWLDQSTPLLAPPRAPSLDPGAQGSGGGGTAPLSAEDLEMIKRTGISKEAFEKSRATLAAQKR